MEKGLLDGKLMYFKKGKLHLTQFWRNGFLDSLNVNETSYSILPYDTAIISFFDSIKVLSNEKFVSRDSLEINILNVPENTLSVSITNAAIYKISEGWKTKVYGKKGDIIRLRFYYRNYGVSSGPLEYVIE